MRNRDKICRFPTKNACQMNLGNGFVLKIIKNLASPVNCVLITPILFFDYFFS